MWYIPTMEYYSALKGRKSCYMLQIDESWGYYAKWNESSAKKQILHDSIYMKYLKQSRWMGHAGEFWQNMVHWRREWQTTLVFLPWEPHEQYEKAKR